MIIALAGQKGGSGKSTVAACLADELHRRGLSVAVVDADPQGTLTVWREQRPEDVDGPMVGHRPELLTSTDVSDADDLMQRLDYDHVVIDVPPGTARPQRAVMLLADLAILPCGPGYSDIWSLAETAELAAAAREFNSDLRVKVLLTRADSRTVLTRKAEKALDNIELPTFDVTLSYLVAYGETLGSGLGVTRYDSGGKAAREIRQFTDEVLAR
jgi:chromosome partitioning protein